MRQHIINTIHTTKIWDMLIIGGGITGAGIAREAARLGLSVLLIEQKDFAWGTSSRSSKMVHGGLRYIASGDIKTTMRSVRERERLLNEAGGLVEEMPYVMAHYKGKFPPPWAFNSLLWVYDFFAGKRYRKHYKKDTFLQHSPQLKRQNFLSATQFADAVTDDSRLVMRVLDEAVRDGALAINYLKAKHLLKNDAGAVIGVHAQDTSKTHQAHAQTAATSTDTDHFDIHAKVVVNATGAWADQLRKQAGDASYAAAYKNSIRPSRGSHVVVAKERLNVEHAYTLMHPVDKRALFVFPWETRTVIGTTDLDHPPLGDDEVGITKAELDYLLVAANDLFPSASLTEKDIISTWAGVRPLISSGQDGERVTPSKEKREHSVWADKGLVTVSGGKLTTFRLIALDVLKQCAEQLSLRLSQHDAAVFTSPAPKSHALSGLDDDVQKRLAGFYGAALDTLLALAQDGELSTIPNTNTLWAELRFAARHEHVVHLDDLLLRRTRLGLLLEQGGLHIKQTIETICTEELGWHKQTWEAEWQRYQDLWYTYYFLA